MVLPFSDGRIARVGRFGQGAGDALRLGFPGAGVIFRYRGDRLDMRLNSTAAANALTIVLDHGDPRTVVLTAGDATVPLLPGHSETGLSGDHLIEIYKRSETWQGLIDLEALLMQEGSDLLPVPVLPARKLLFVGDSVTCGANVSRENRCSKDPARPSEDPFHAFDMVLARRLDAQPQLVCYGGRGLQRDYRGLNLRDGVLNAPEFLDLAIATDEPAKRQTWPAKSWVPDAIVVSLGTNDFNLQKTKPLNEPGFMRDYAALLTRLRREYPQSHILITEGAIVTDPLLRRMVRQTADRMHDSRIQWAPATHYPGDACDGHPTLEQHDHMADDLEPQLRKALGW